MGADEAEVVRKNWLEALTFQIQKKYITNGYRE